MEILQKLLSYPLSVLFYFLFGSTLLIFHPLQWLALKLGGASGHRSMVNIMNLCLLRCLHVLGTTISMKMYDRLPYRRPIIFVSNHQSMFDIPLISWFVRRQKPKFISKIELGKGIPSISFNLRNGGNVLIDRKNPKQSIPAIGKFARFIQVNNFAAVIFPEGTRSKDGQLKPFATTGIKLLLKNIPDALVVPLVVHNSWKLLKFGNFPMGLGVQLKLEVLEPVNMRMIGSPEEVIDNVRSRMLRAIQK
ncbi:1-acyl-sn-glycerol-3-phosphate acyltransferase [Aquimarina sp. ERC-38]|uniref:lysophospholipid acyltransferase family protein n=1 Tax=Aquimarina sp. ERC-38 TaxID=2949996 RepID=UPI002246D764|nr:lysophospholipid acyltransferase family protein [Aquimarina sp. ERC-38]UZO81908.1 1-acyl-sn-glycerol-3-phosphate acyltransferase [Aquimarina sp. ERC-38]